MDDVDIVIGLRRRRLPESRAADVDVQDLGSAQAECVRERGDGAGQFEGVGHRALVVARTRPSRDRDLAKPHRISRRPAVAGINMEAFPR